MRAIPHHLLPIAMYDIDPHLAELYDQQETYDEDILLIQKLIGQGSVRRILEPFCGTGRILILLALAGYEVVGLDRPLVQDGFITVPNAPGLGVEPNEEVIRQHLYEPGYFEPTPEWDGVRSWDRLWS